MPPLGRDRNAAASDNNAMQPSTQKHLGSVVTRPFVPADGNRSSHLVHQLRLASQDNDVTRAPFFAYGLLMVQLCALAGCSDSNVLYSDDASHRNARPGSVTKASLTFNPDNTSFDGMELLSTPIGDFELTSSLDAIHSKGPSLLRIVGGRNQRLEFTLSPGIALPAEMKVACNRISHSDPIAEDLFIVESSSDPENWKVVSRTDHSGWFKGGNAGTDGFVDLLFRIPAGTKRIRFTSNTVTDNIVPHHSGIRIREIAFTKTNSE